MSAAAVMLFLDQMRQVLKAWTCPKRNEVPCTWSCETYCKFSTEEGLFTVQEEQGAYDDSDDGNSENGGA